MAAASAPLNLAITRVGSFGDGDDNVPSSDDRPSQISNSETRASSPALTVSERRNNDSSAAATPVATIGTMGMMINQRVKASQAISQKIDANPAVAAICLTPSRRPCRRVNDRQTLIAVNAASAIINQSGISL